MGDASGNALNKTKATLNIRHVVSSYGSFRLHDHICSSKQVKKKPCNENGKTLAKLSLAKESISQCLCIFSKMTENAVFFVVLIMNILSSKAILLVQT